MACSVIDALFETYRQVKHLCKCYWYEELTHLPACVSIITSNLQKNKWRIILKKTLV